MKTGKVLLALLGGVAAGVALGVLFAPAKGSETREKLMDSFDGLADNIKGKANDIKEKMADNVNKMKDRARGQSEESGYTSGSSYGSRSSM